MNMLTEIEFAQNKVPNQVTEPLEQFPFTQEKQNVERHESDFVER